MSDTPPNSELTVGDCLGVALDVAAWDAVRAPVDLSVACMFTHEPVGAVLAGGLLHLDQTLGQALTQLRAEGVFTGQAMDTLLVNRPPRTLVGKALLIVGLGEPEAWTPGMMARATAKAVQVAAALDAVSVAFAPSIKDAGLSPPVLRDFDQAMVDGLLEGISRAARLEALGLGDPIALRRWTFDANAGHAAQVAAAFRRALSTTPDASAQA